MKKRLICCLVLFVVLSGINIMAQDVSLPTPTSESPDPIRGPAEGILELKISDGLKRFLLADLYARYGGYEKAFEIVDYTKTVEILDKKLTVEEDPEVIRLLEYQRQKIEGMKQALATPIPILPETIKHRADAEYQNVLYLKKHGKPEQTIQSALLALKLYQQIENIEGQLLVRYQLARLYKEIGNNPEALRQAEKFMELEQELEFIKKYEEMQKLLKELEGKTTTD